MNKKLKLQMTQAGSSNSQQFQNSSTSNDFERLQNERQAEFQTIQRR